MKPGSVPPSPATPNASSTFPLSARDAGSRDEPRQIQPSDRSTSLPIHARPPEKRVEGSTRRRSGDLKGFQEAASARGAAPGASGPPSGGRARKLRIDPHLMSTVGELCGYLPDAPLAGDSPHVGRLAAIAHLDDRVKRLLTMFDGRRPAPSPGQEDAADAAAQQAWDHWLDGVARLGEGTSRAELEPHFFELGDLIGDCLDLAGDLLGPEQAELAKAMHQAVHEHAGRMFNVGMTPLIRDNEDFAARLREGQELCADDPGQAAGVIPRLRQEYADCGFMNHELHLMSRLLADISSLFGPCDRATPACPEKRRHGNRDVFVNPTWEAAHQEAINYALRISSSQFSLSSFCDGPIVEVSTLSRRERAKLVRRGTGDQAIASGGGFDIDARALHGELEAAEAAFNVQAAAVSAMLYDDGNLVRRFAPMQEAVSKMPDSIRHLKEIIAFVRNMSVDPDDRDEQAAFVQRLRERKSGMERVVDALTDYLHGHDALPSPRPSKSAGRTRAAGSSARASGTFGLTPLADVGRFADAACRLKWFEDVVGQLAGLVEGPDVGPGGDTKSVAALIAASREKEAACASLVFESREEADGHPRPEGIYKPMAVTLSARRKAVLADLRTEFEAIEALARVVDGFNRHRPPPETTKDAFLKKLRQHLGRAAALEDLLERPEVLAIPFQDELGAALAAERPTGVVRITLEQTRDGGSFLKVRFHHDPADGQAWLDRHDVDLRLGREARMALDHWSLHIHFWSDRFPKGLADLVKDLCATGGAAIKKATGKLGIMEHALGDREEIGRGTRSEDSDEGYDREFVVDVLASNVDKI